MRSLILTIAMLVLLYPLPTHSVVAATSAEAALLGGTIVSINQEAFSLTILFPTGESRALSVRDARLLHGLSIGDHVTFELNHEHAIVKLTKLPTDPAN